MSCVSNEGDDLEIHEKIGSRRIDFNVPVKKHERYSVILDWSERNGFQGNTSIVSTPSYKNKEAILKWIATNSFSVYSLPETNWLEYDRIKFAIYSENKTDTYVQLRFNNPRISKDTPMAPYYVYKIKVDFIGWKEFEVSFGLMGSGYRPQWGNISSISFDCKGWNLEPDDRNVLYFSNFYLGKSDYSVQVDDVKLETDAFDEVIAKWKIFLVGYEQNIPKLPAYETRIEEISNNCRNVWTEYQKSYNGQRDSAWGLEMPFGTPNGEVKIDRLYSNILAMAKGYATVGSDYYQNENLLEDIKIALEYGYTYYYGEEVIKRGIYGNWWYWDIGIPKKLVNILLVLENELEREALTRYLSPFDFLNPYPTMTACNRVDITYSVLASALLQRDLERSIIAIKLMEVVFEYVSSGDGFYEDGSFIQHDKLPYTGGYGIDMLREVTNLCYILGNTVFAFSGTVVANQYNWIFESFRPVIYGENLFSAVRGRSVHRNTSEEIYQRVAVTSMIKMQDYAPADIQKKLEALIRHYMLSTGRNYAEDVPLPLVEYAVNLYKDRSVTPLKGYHVVKVFGNMDRVVQHTENYGVSLSFSSDRIYKYEAINNENMNGWYQGDGMIHLYTDGYDYNYGYYHYVNPYLLPGTTITGQRREERNLSKNILNSSPLAGGVEHGAYGIGVFELGYPKGNGVFESNIAARKSYFLFDNEIVAVGSGINDDSNTMVATVVENRLWREDDSLVADGVSQVLSESDEKLAGQYMHFTNMGGYVFLDGKTARYRKSTNTNSFLEIVLEHGKNPKNECYSYVYLPEATAKATRKYNRKPDVTILAQTETVHVVREKKLGLTGYVFFEADSTQGISADNACAVMVESKNGRTVIAVSDPSHLRDEITLTVELDDVDRIVACDEAIEAIFSDGYVTLKVDTKDSDGRTFSIALK